MSWRLWLPGAEPPLTALQRARLAAWRALAEPSLDLDPKQASFVVVDVETSGLNASRDRLLAIGAIKVEQGRIALAASFYCVVRQSRASDIANILVHRIGGSEQVSGIEPAEALLAFLEFSGKHPLVAYHAPFDETVVRRALRRFLGLRLGTNLDLRWLDLAFLAPALIDASRARAPLDYWLERYDIMPRQRHHALADAAATARLLQIILAAAGAEGTSTVAALFEVAESERWVQRASRQSL
jgi:DNA polymerase III subunit epsilon